MTTCNCIGIACPNYYRCFSNEKFYPYNPYIPYQLPLQSIQNDVPCTIEKLNLIEKELKELKSRQTEVNKILNEKITKMRLELKELQRFKL